MPKLTGETNVDEQVNATATLQKDTQRREDHGQDDLEDVGALCMFSMLSWTRRLSTEELSITSSAHPSPARATRNADFPFVKLRIYILGPPSSTVMHVMQDLQ